MDFNKLFDDNGMYLYQDDSFNTISTTLYFDANKSNRDHVLYDVLCEYILKANSKYTRVELDEKTKELYGIYLELYTSTLGSKNVFIMKTNMISPSVIKDNYSKDAFEFASDLFLHPDFTKENILEDVKKTLIANTKTKLAIPSHRARNLFFNTVLPNPNEEYEYSNDVEYKEKMINSVTLDELKKVYEETINEDRFHTGLAFGNMTDEEFKEFRKYFPFKGKKRIVDYYEKEIPKEGIDIIPDSNVKESTVYVTYDIRCNDRGIRNILRDIYNGSSELCMHIVRDKYGLAYSSHAIFHPFGDLLIIKSNIEKSNLDKLISAVDEVVEITQDEKKVKEYLDRAKEALKIEDYQMSENIDDLSYEVSAHIRSISPDYNQNEFIRNIDNIKEEDVTKVSKTLTRKHIFMYRGDAE